MPQHQFVLSHNEIVTTLSVTNAMSLVQPSNTSSSLFASTENYPHNDRLYIGDWMEVKMGRLCSGCRPAICTDILGNRSGAKKIVVGNP